MISALLQDYRKMTYLTCRVVQKFGTIILYALTLPNINRFSKLFHHQNQEKICNNTITKDPITPQVCRYTTSVSYTHLTLPTILRV